MDKILNVFSGDKWALTGHAGLLQQISRAKQDSGLLQQISRAKQNEDTRIYSPDELAELNRVIARTGNYSALSDNAKAQLENTYTPEQKRLRAWSYAKQAADRESSPGNMFANGLLSFFTSGISDVARGDMPGDALSKWGLPARILNPITAALSTSSAGSYDLVAGVDKAGDTDGGLWDKLAAGLDRSFDPQGGAVDATTRWIGDGIYKVAPSVTPYLQTAGTAIGGLIGAVTPMTPAGGAAVGNAIGGKLAQGTRDYDYLGSAKDAGLTYLTAAALSGATDLLSPYISGISATVGNTLDDLVGGTLAGNVGEKATSWAGKALLGGLIKKGVNTGANALLGALTPSVANELSGLLTGSTDTTATDTTTGGLLSSSKTNLLSTPEVAATLPVTKTTTGLTPINWASEVQKLTMPVFLKKKKDEKDEGYMDYKFRPKDYLVNYLGG